METRRLNEPVNFYKIFKGFTAKSLAQMQSEGFEPLSVAQFMRRRIELFLLDEGKISITWNSPYFTRDCVASHPDGRIKIVSNFEEINDLVKGLKLTHDGNGFLLPEEVYENLKYKEFSKAQVETYATSRPVTLSEVLNNPFWNAVADEDLLKKYAEYIFLLDEKNMGVYFLNTPTEHPILSPLELCNYKNEMSALVSGYSRLDGSSMIGVKKQDVMPLEEAISVVEIIARKESSLTRHVWRMLYGHAVNEE